MRNKSKKEEMARHKNARVVYVNCPETELYLNLSINIDKAFKYLRNNVGTSDKVTIEHFNEIRMGFIEKVKEIELFIAQARE